MQETQLPNLHFCSYLMMGLYTEQPQTPCNDEDSCISYILEGFIAASQFHVL